MREAGESAIKSATPRNPTANTPAAHPNQRGRRAWVAAAPRAVAARRMARGNQGVSQRMVPISLRTLAVCGSSPFWALLAPAHCNAYDASCKAVAVTPLPKATNPSILRRCSSAPHTALYRPTRKIRKQQKPSDTR